jgi:hypothetical protein
MHMRPNASPQPLQILTALRHRELPAVDAEHMESVKKPAMNSIKRFSYHRGNNKTRQNTEAQFWNGLISEFVHRGATKILEQISEGIRDLHRKK